MQEKSLLETPVQFVPSVGPARARLLQRLDIANVEQLLYTPPRRYEDRSQFTPINQLATDRPQTVLGQIEQVGGHRVRYKRRMSIIQIRISDATGRLRVTWFNQPYLLQRLAVGQSIVLYGQVEGGAQPRMTSPDYELVKSDERDSTHMGRIVPIYATTARLSQRHRRQMVQQALERFSFRMVDPLPASVRRAQRLMDLPAAIRAIHFPATMQMIEPARKRLAFDECFTWQLVVQTRRHAVMHTRKSQRYHAGRGFAEQFIAQLPFQLTKGQQHIRQELQEDLQQPHPMNRLLQGDVGSGKTVLAVWALLLAVQSGYQAAFMAPTELLAEQHARTLRRWVEPLGVTVCLLSRSVTSQDRKAVAAMVAQDQPLIVVGTHTLIQSTVMFRRLTLIVIDEQHKFGVVQRARLRDKGQQPDVLIMTATPIPRTLSMTVYGDVDISTLRELPPGRRPPETRWFRESMRAQMHQLMHHALEAGHQAYVVYPAIDETTTQDLKAATQMAHEFRRLFPAYHVGLVHGRLQAARRRTIMEQFVRNEVHILVSTSVIEVGIDVPNATVMVLEHGERLGLAQLHQLRGRIGRGSAASLCIVMSDTNSPQATERLQAFVRLRDGFALAERDLELRGPGQVLGTKQHGVQELTFTRLLTDQPVIQAAREEAVRLTNPLGSARERIQREQLVRRLLEKYKHIDPA